MAEHLAEIGDAGRSQRLDRSGRDRVHADAFGTEIQREITHASFKARLGQTHHVVVDQRTLGAEITEREDRTLAALHLRTRGLRQRGEAVAGNIVRDREPLARQAFEETTIERFARRIADRMHQDVETIPALAEFSEYAVDLRIIGDVARQHDVRPARLRGRFHARLELVHLIGKGEFRAFAMHRFGDAAGDRALAGDADDQCALSLQETHAASVDCVVVGSSR